MVRMILFDVDGVLLSEERYFDASALTVWELVASPRFLGIDASFTTSPDEGEIRAVRRHVFVNDEVLKFVKNRGINANWDMVYLTFAHQLIYALAAIRDHHRELVERILNGDASEKVLQQVGKALEKTSFSLDYATFVTDLEATPAQKHELLNELNRLAEARIGISTSVFGRTSQLWELCRDTFQEWYLGDEKYAFSVNSEIQMLGKNGFLHDEIPIVEPADVRKMLEQLRSAGITLGIGTGRPNIETIEPLTAIQLMDCFEPMRVVTASTVLQAEEVNPAAAPLAKPHPYCYLKGIQGMETPDSEVLATALPLPTAGDILIVGDSLADLMAARAIGCQFAATLTGLSGADARSMFEQHKADYILDNVLGVAGIVLS